MKTLILAKLAQLETTLDQLNHAGWVRSHTWTPEVRALAERVQDNTMAKAERCRGVLLNRYGLDYRYTRLTAPTV